MAFIKKSDVEKIIENCGLRKFTLNTIISKGELMIELEKIRTKMYAIVHEEIQSAYAMWPGLSIFNSFGQSIAAFSVSGKKTVYSNDRLLELTYEIVKFFSAISAGFGYKSLL